MTDSKNEGYLGNTLIKKAGVEVKYTKKQLGEYVKCSSDPCYTLYTSGIPRQVNKPL